MVALWTRFENLFPGHWNRRFANQADSDRAMMVWAEALIGYTSDEFKRGVDALTKLRFPPTCGEFKNLCRPVSDAPRTYLGQNANDPFIKKLHNENKNKFIALPENIKKEPKEYLEKIREMLNNK